MSELDRRLMEGLRQLGVQSASEAFEVLTNMRRSETIAAALAPALAEIGLEAVLERLAGTLPESETSIPNDPAEVVRRRGLGIPLPENRQ